jgi:hypothetical protein
MLTDKTIKVKVSKKNIEHFKKLNIKCNLKDIIEIDPINLNEGSHILVNVKCDICGNEKVLLFQKYIKNIKNGGIYCCSPKCAQEKVKNTSLKNFGSEYYTQTKEYKKRYKETSLEKYGVEHSSQNEDIKNKGKRTSMERYGVDNPSKSQFIKDKIKNTFLEKYGVKNISELDYIKDKISKKSIHFFKDNYNIDIIKYYKNEYYILCHECNNIYNINKKTLRNRLIGGYNPCTKCNTIMKQTSIKEIELLQFIEKNYEHTIISNSKDIIKPYELDIYIPDSNLAFEFNGVYWHNELNKEDDYHYKKTDLCLEKGIQLIHIWEDDWIYKQDIVKSMILNKLGKTSNKIYARKCKIKEINDNKLIKEFLDNNHLQGFVGSKIKIGLFYENELVSLITFGNLRKNMNSISINKNDYEMLRFCNKLNTNVIGGASKLFNYFINNYKYNSIISYADRSHSNGNLYKQLEFKLQDITPPNYYYVIDDIRHYRYNFRKDILIKEGYDSNKTEHEIMLERKIYRIYNSGNYKFIYE